MTSGIYDRYVANDVKPTHPEANSANGQLLVPGRNPVERTVDSPRPTASTEVAFHGRLQQTQGRKMRQFSHSCRTTVDIIDFAPACRSWISPAFHRLTPGFYRLGFGQTKTPLTI